MSRIMPILSVQQPYASALVMGLKKEEYRSWQLYEKYLDKWILINATTQTHDLPWLQIANSGLKQNELDELNSIIAKEKTYHCIVGAVSFSKCTINPTSGIFHWQVHCHRELLPPIMGIKGKLGVWTIDWDELPYRQDLTR